MEVDADTSAPYEFSVMENRSIHQSEGEETSFCLRTAVFECLDGTSLTGRIDCVEVLSAACLCPSCRFTGGAELHNQSHGSSAPHRPAGPIRHHYLRHHRPGALHGQDAQDLLLQATKYVPSANHACEMHTLTRHT